MGVNGLWTVIQPCARPTNLATLNRKRLAVDASIWIYQFLKAVRDKEGNALRNSHVVGFFRRICKLLWFGIRPVFVFDGGAPALKRQTITSRKRRREGRREDAVRTAGKLLAVQMQRIAEEESEKRRRQKELARPAVEEPVEEIPNAENLVYVDELGMDQQERQKNRKFFKQDAYHLPDMHTSIEGMGKPDDPRIMSIHELEEYARQFNRGEDINLYDFSKIDFDGEFFKSLPPADRYNILNAARVRSRLRMGLSKEQLEDMFPNRMDFSRFQIERVQERNRLTQRLMKEAGMTGLDLTINGGARIAGEKDREYILVKNDGVEGGWALGVVSKEKDVGEMHKPIDVDALDFQYQAKEEEWEDEEEEFEDVPIEGINRLPKIPSHVQQAVERQRQVYDSRVEDIQDDATLADEDDDSLFVQGPSASIDSLFNPEDRDGVNEDEEEDLNRAIAMSLKTQHSSKPSRGDDVEEEEDFEDVPMPEWKQTAVEQAKPVTRASGSMIAHIVNNRANAAVQKRKRSEDGSDDEMDLRAALSKAKKKKKAAPVRTMAAPTVPNMPNAFGGPLPFEKLDWKSSIFSKKTDQPKQTAAPKSGRKEPEDEMAGGFELEDDMAGGFEREEDQEAMVDDEAPRPLPPWMQQEATDIRESMRAQRDREKEINEEDREAAMEEEKRREKEAFIEIESSDDDNSDVEILDAPPPKLQKPSRLSPATQTRVSPPQPDSQALQDGEMPVNEHDGEVPEKPIEVQRSVDTAQSPSRSELSSPEPDFEEVEVLGPRDGTPIIGQSGSPEPEFEEVEASEPQAEGATAPRAPSPETTFEDVSASNGEPEISTTVAVDENGDVIINGDEALEEEEYSDPEDEELLAQMAEEAEEHARFASQLNNRSEKENQEAYERELKALRTQQKKDRRDADEVTQIMITECQALLRLFGIPYITAPMEAEAQCAELVRLGLVDGIVTDDSDTFLFGGTRVYKNMFNSNKFVECYLGSDLEKELSLSREQLISLAQLLGSDYTEGLPGVGPVTAVEILSEFPGKEGLEAFRDWWKDVQINNRPEEMDGGSTFRKKFRKSQATKLFLPLGFPNPAVFDAYIKPEVDQDQEHFQWGVPDVDGLRRFLMATIGWSQERTDEVLVPVIRDMNQRDAVGTQSNITRYFEGSVGVGAKEAFAPRHRVQSSKRMVDAVNKLRAKATVDDLSEEAPLEAGEGTAARGRRQRTKQSNVVQDGDDDFVDDDNGDDGPQEVGRRKKRGKASKT
ncbi:uncharacterized protein JN550_003945 [Neoarthrinium moseri]|uniref:uncharacterized protein n=1 Tax=Neoarthrinium moseri TaxID=1658444 RepID=UPI001FDD709C|nr:uncharacterized protein JN550_003945 [Neoarthrinium moseri]KAI1872226.1 hypothetical protein JN550_003945 [Neoarthrinium moseri]